MIIAVDISNGFDSKSSSTVSYLLSIIQTLKTTSSLEVIFLTSNDNNPYEAILISLGRVENIPFRRKGALQRKWWYAIKLPALLKKHKANIFITTDRPIKTKGLFRQIVVVANSHQLQKITSAKGYHNNEIDQLIVPSSFLQTRIATLFPAGENKVVVMVPGKKEKAPIMSVEEKQKIRETYTLGKTYFIYTGGTEDVKTIVYLLKAFSLFKKRQKSEWKLVLAGDKPGKEQALTALLQNYKYKEDIVPAAMQEKEIQLELVAAAYALIIPFRWEGNGAYIPEAIAAGIPIIAKGGDALSDLLSDAALYIPEEEPTALAEQIMLLYKDENLRKRLAEKTMVHEAHFDPVPDVEAVRRVIGMQ